MKDYLQEVEDAGDAVIIAKIATKGDPAQYAKMDISWLVPKLVPETVLIHALHAVFLTQKVAKRVLLDTNSIRLKKLVLRLQNVKGFV